MDRIETHKTLILEVMAALQQEFADPQDPISVVPITDHENGHYLLFNHGWTETKRVYGCFLHIDLAPDGKVWLQHDGTDLVVAQMLLDKGIAKECLVLGFHHPSRRKDTGLAVA